MTNVDLIPNFWQFVNLKTGKFWPENPKIKNVNKFRPKCWQKIDFFLQVKKKIALVMMHTANPNNVNDQRDWFRCCYRWLVGLRGGTAHHRPIITSGAGFWQRLISWFEMSRRGWHGLGRSQWASTSTIPPETFKRILAQSCTNICIEHYRKLKSIH